MLELPCQCIAVQAIFLNYIKTFEVGYMIIPVINPLLYYLSEHTFLKIAFILLGWWFLHLMVSLRRRVRLNIPPLSLSSTDADQKGTRFPADGETRVAPHYFCLMHKFVLLLLWTYQYSLILKRPKLLIITTQAYRYTFLLIHYCCSAGCSAEWK